MQRGWRYTGAVFALVFALWAQQSWQLSLVDPLGPGPGLFPFLLSVAGFVLALALSLRSRGTPPDETTAAGPEPLFPRGRALRAVLAVLGGLAAVAALLEPLGFQLTVAAFCLLLLPVLGARNWLVIAVFAGAASFGVHALFSDLLKVPLPGGILAP